MWYQQGQASTLFSPGSTICSILLPVIAWMAGERSVSGVSCSCQKCIVPEQAAECGDEEAVGVKYLRACEKKKKKKK